MKDNLDNKEGLLHKTPLKILSYLCRVPYIPHYEREIARAVGVSVGAVNQSLKLFSNLGIVTRQKKGQLYLYLVEAGNPLVKEFKKFENILDITGIISKIKDVCSRIVLYGSCAAGLDTLESDVDLFIVSREKKKVLREIKKEAKGLKRDIKTLIVSTEEYLSMRNKKEAFLDELDIGIVLYEKK